MSEQTARLVDQLRRRLRATIRRMTLAETAFGLAVTLGVLAALWLGAAALEAGFWLAPTPRSIIVGLIAAGLLGLIGTMLVRPLLRLAGVLAPPPEEAVARQIGTQYPEVSDRLVNILQLAGGRRSPAAPDMIDRAVQSLGTEVQSVQFEQIEDFGRARRAGRLASLPILGLLLFLIAAPNTFLDASSRLLAPATAFAPPAPFQLHVTPGDAQLVRGDSLQITVQATGQALPSTMTLAVRNEGEDVVDTITLRADAAGLFRHTLVNVRQPMRYRVEAAPVTSRWYTADVIARPLVRSLQVTLTPPAYTNLPTRRLDANVGDVAALPGTRVALDVRLGGPPVDQALVAFDDGRRDTLAVTAGTASGAFTLRREGTYRVLLRSTEGIMNRAPIEYALTLRADARPSVVFLAPPAEANLPESLTQPLRLRLSDDFGFSRLRLYYRVAERRFGTPDSAFSAFDLPLDQPRQLDQQVDYRWQLAEKSNLDLVPGDVVEYYVRAWDNDAVAHYKSARTATQRLRLPSLAEKYEELDEQQNSAAEALESLVDETESISQQFDELKRELRREQEGDWEDQRQLDEIQRRQQQLQSKVESVAKQVEQITRQMQENNLADPQTTQLYQELQQVIKDINAPELMDALKQLQKAMKNLDLRQMQQAMQNFEFNEQQYQEQLKRSLELFERLRVQQKLDEAARRAADLSQQEQRLAEATKALQEKQHEQEAPGAESESAPQDSSAASESPTEQSPTEPPPGAEKPPAQPEASPQKNEPSPQKPSDPSTPPESTNEELAHAQEQARRQMEQLQEEMQKLQQQMQEVQSAPKQQMQEVMQQLQQQQLPQQMQQNSQQLRQNQLQKARQGQQQMQQQLQQMQQRLQQMQQGMRGQQMQMNLAGLRQALDNTLLLSRDQEALRNEVGALSTDSPSLRPLAQEQVALAEGLRTVSDSLQQLARKVPQMSRAVQKETGDALRAMQEATDALSERNARPAQGHQKASMMHLNELALMLSNLLEQLMNSQGQGGGMSMQQMAQQLRQMAGNQQQLNQQIQQFLNNMQGSRLSADEQKRLQQLARQQEAIRRQLEQLGQGSGLRDEMLGDLDRIAEQMEETIRELQRNEQDRRTIERQQQILTRMLDAQRALQTQGKEQQRESQQPEQEFDRASPGELTREEQIDQLRRDLIRAMETGYAPDYEELIRRYFELLQSAPDSTTVPPE